ncbi:zinc-binding dehydrogenase [Streptomyces violaceusniger]|uniref:Enoyl reductase (ER) domain-containing protein n=1 Tax=Streptomyces violaceusniger TaxID=68280 RepID=A0A4D4LFK7_STRVO|nr:hypothetical protein SVIO_110540 [Streptomyces violaceusniger]
MELGVAPSRTQTIVDFEARQLYGVKSDGSFTARNAPVLAELAELVSSGALEVPVTAFPLSQVREAYALLERRHTRGKIVLIP